MRLLGIVLVLVGGALTVRAVIGATSERRPRDVAWALAAPVALAVAVLGAILVFVPGFLDSAAP